MISVLACLMKQMLHGTAHRSVMPLLHSRAGDGLLRIISIFPNTKIRYCHIVTSNKDLNGCDRLLLQVDATNTAQ
jgi:hypothetical protein